MSKSRKGLIISLGILLFALPILFYLTPNEVVQRKLVKINSNNKHSIEEAAALGYRRIAVNNPSEDGEAWDYYKQAFDAVNGAKNLSADERGYCMMLSNLGKSRCYQDQNMELLLDGLKKPIELINKAQKQKAFVYDSHHNEELFLNGLNFNGFDQLMNLLMIKAEYEVENHQIPLALNTIFSAITLAEDMFKLGQFYGLSSIYGHQLPFITLLKEIVDAPNISDADLTLVVEQLAKLEEMRDLYSLKLRWIRWQRIADLTRPAMARRYYEYSEPSYNNSSSNYIIRLSNGLTRFMRGYNRLSYFADMAVRVDKGLQGLERVADGSAIDLFDEVKQSEYFNGGLLGDKRNFFYHWKNLTKLNAIKTIAILKQYKNSNHRFPDSLQQLPVPNDAIAGSQFHYNADLNHQKAIFWSDAYDNREIGEYLFDIDNYQPERDEFLFTVE